MKRLFLLSCVSLLALSFCKGQVADSITCKSVYYPKQDRNFYLTATKAAEYSQGDDSLYQYVRENTTYEGFKRDDIKFGERVIVLLYIDESGKLIDMQPISSKGQENGFFEKQVIAILKDIHYWTPAECNGKKIPFRKTFAIRFSLRKIGKYLEQEDNDCNHK